MDISAVVLNKLLEEQNLEIWSKLKLVFLDPAYSSLYSAITRYYEKYHEIPNFESLEVVLKDTHTAQTLLNIKLAEVPEVDSEVAINALIDAYTQNEAIGLIDKFIDKVPVLDSVEIKESISNIALELDEKTLTTEGVYEMNNILLFHNPEDLARERIHLGFNNTFDAVLGGCARQELILVGGERGSGKSIICNNIVNSQYEAGNCAVYFSIEMIARETFERHMAMHANINYQNLKKNALSSEELLALVKARANMFQDSEDLVSKFMKDGDRYSFETQLIKEKKLKENNQITIIDDRALTLSAIDLHIGKLKARHGDKLTTVVVDYLNQIVVEGNYSQFDWQPQIIISKKLKELARKYDVLMVSPYQIDAGGQARFAKGILDAADIGLLMKPHDKDLNAISFETTKIRGAREMSFTSGMDWDTLRISPIDVKVQTSSDDGNKIKKAKSASVDDSTADIPWDA